MKKTLALVLALAMVFSTITVAFAEEAIGAEAQLCADLGMLKGETGTVDAAYVATAPKRIQAAIMMLRLKGLEAEALAFTGEDNFADGNIAWAEGANLLAYLKANPQLGWQGDGVNFNPDNLITAQEYYKVLLEALGYKQTVEGVVVGDFTWAEVMTFAAEKGLVAPAGESFTVNDLAIATVSALKTNLKDVETTLVASLVEAGKIDEAKAVAAGLIADKNATVAVAVDEAMAAGNAVVDVVFEDDVDPAAAGNIANYSIEGLTINAVTVTGSDSVRLDTEAMSSGKIYKLTVGEKTVLFTAVKKFSGGPEIDSVVGEDVEEVVITFTKNIDFATGTDIANYTLNNGAEIVKAEIDPDEPAQVILTTEGLKNKTKYKVKVTGVKSVDGVAKKSDSDDFTTKYDLVAPKIKAVDDRNDVEVQTNQRVVVYFTEKVDETSAEDLANYSIKVDDEDGAELEIVSVTWDDDDKDNVEIITEPMDKSEDYELSISNIADRRKVANVMTRTATADFEGIDEDDTNPTWAALQTLSPTTLLVTFTDDSKLDEESALDINNYELEDLEIESIETVKDSWKTFKALLTIEEMETGETYKLTISDVLDEFGNALKEKHMMAKGQADEFAAVYVTDAYAIDENTIEVVFSDEIDEDTAEDISNYDIDEEIGAPTEAEYEFKVSAIGSEGDPKQHIVTLTTNDLIDGYENAFAGTVNAEFQAYDLTVDGVLDLAANELYYEIEIDSDREGFDTTRPDLDDVDVLNSEVVAFIFDEAVWYEPGTQVTVEATDGTDVVLTARDYTDDFTVIEFSGAGLVPDTEYTVTGIVYGGLIEDLAGNNLNSIPADEFEFTAVDDSADEAVEVDSYEQVNAKTFEVTFTRFVSLYVDENDNDVIEADELLAEDDTLTISNDDGDLIWTVTYDDDVVTFVKEDTILDDDVEYEFNIADFICDMHMNIVENADGDDVTELQADYEDEDAPYVEEVVAENRDIIKITFSEEIPVMTTAEADAFLDALELNNYDLDDDVTIVNSVLADLLDNDGDNVLKIKVAKPLEARYEYELIVPKEIFEDYAEIENKDEDSFYFDGTNLVDI